MIGHEKFAKLRFSQFIPPGNLKQLENWEFKGRLWVGEALGFSEWLRPQAESDVLRSVSLSLEELHPNTSKKILEAMQLPLQNGMTELKVMQVLGEVNRTLQFKSDRKTYEFSPTDERPYQISCTVHSSRGLIYLVVMMAGRNDEFGKAGS